MVAYTFYLKELSDSSTWQDISSAVVKDSFQLKKGFGALSSALDTSSLSLQIHMASLADAAALHVSQKQLKMQIDGSTVFEGVSFDSADIDLGQSTDLVHVRMKFKPYSSLFADAVVPSDTALTDVKICDGTDTAHSLIHILFDMIVANLPSPMPDILSGSFSVSTTISNTKTLPLVLLEAGESILDYLTDVLYQNGYAFYMDQFAATVVEPYATGRTPSDTLAITSIIDNPKISQAPYVVEKRCVVRFPRISSYSNEVVYELNKERDNGTGEPSQVIVLADGDYYPMDSDDAASTLEADYGSDRETDDIELAHVATPALSYVAKKLSGSTTVDATLSVEISELQSKLAKIQLLNDIEGVDVSLRNIVVTAGTAYYRDWSEKYQDNDTTSTRKDEIDGLYMPDSATAQGFVARYRAEIDAQRTPVTFQTHLVFAPNALITITGLPYNLLIRRVTQLNDSHDLYEYDCVAYSLQAITVGGIIQIHRDKRPQDGLDSYLMQLAAPQGTVIRVSGRGTLETTTLKLTALTANIEASAIIWAASVGTLSEVSGEPFSRSLACSTVSADQTTITISATIGGVTFSASIGIQKVYKTTLPLALGTVTSLPTTVGGEALVAGDYFLVGSSFTVGEITFGVGQIWEYTGSAWALSTDGAKIMAAMDDFSKLEVDADSLVAGNLFAKRFIALEATIKTLFARLLEIQSGGAIFSGFSADGTPPETGRGFHLSWTGLMQSMNALLIGTLRTGLNAPTNARVGIRDSSGIISRTFTGSGTDDIQFQEEGAVEVQIELKITALATDYTVGSNGPAGGHIFYKDGTRYLEAAPAASEWTEKVWGPTNVNVGGTSLLLFKGSDNTALIVAALGAGDYAARLCYDLSYGGVSDWFLPSRDELVAMHTNLRLAGIGGFANEYYWCSQNVSTDSGYVKKFDTGGYAHVEYKNSTERVRAARMFSSPDLYQWRSREKSGGTWGAWSDWSASQKTNEVVTLGSYGIKVIFETDTGHTVDDLWAFEQGAMRGLAIQKSDGTEYLSASNGVVSVAQINVQDTTNKVWGAVAN